LTVEKRDDNEYYVEFKNVSFQYPNSNAYALKHVNLKFKVGENLDGTEGVDWKYMTTGEKGIITVGDLELNKTYYYRYKKSNYNCFLMTNYLSKYVFHIISPLFKYSCLKVYFLINGFSITNDFKIVA